MEFPSCSVKVHDKFVMLPSGVAFYPKDEEIVSHLIGKVSGHTDGGGSHFIKDIQLYKHEPWELSSLARDSGHQRMYFFTRLRSRSHSERVHRKAVCGFWKISGRSSYINDKDGKPIAVKKLLTYYKKDEKTQWLMEEYTLLHDHEYTLVRNQLPNQDNEKLEMLPSWALCVVYHSKKNYGS